MKPIDYDREKMPSVRVYLPPSIIELLNAAAKKSRVSVSRVVAYAIDNELSAPQPFDYPSSWPTGPHVTGSYLHEGQLINAYLKKFPMGLGMDQLLLQRRDIGIVDKQNIKLGVAEMMNSGLFEIITRTVRWMPSYCNTFDVIRRKDVSGPTEAKRRKLLAIQKQVEREIAALEE